MLKPQDIAYLQQIALFEATHDLKIEYRLGWRHRDIRISPGALSHLYLEGCLDQVYRSNSRTGYRLSQKGKDILETGHIVAGTPPGDAQLLKPILNLPEDLFTVIEGYEDIKDLTRQALISERPVHILYSGVPGSAKTLFLLELAQLGASYVLGSQVTKSGLADLLFEAQPELLLVDEIDRIGTKDIAILLSLAQTGIVSETKHGKTREVKLNTKILAASNSTRMPPELLSRFLVLHFQPYSREDFLKVATNVLQKRESLEAELAAYIAAKVWALPARFADPRQAIRVARLARTREAVDRVMEVILKYSDNAGEGPAAGIKIGRDGG